MKKIEIKGSNKTPRLVIDSSSGIIKILGRSTMINPHSFYPNFIELINNYCENPYKNTYLIIDLEHYNSLSLRYLLNVIDLISKIDIKNGYNVNINWYYDSDDKGIEEDIEVISNIIQFKINALEYEYELA